MLPSGHRWQSGFAKITVTSAIIDSILPKLRSVLCSPGLATLLPYPEVLSKIFSGVSPTFHQRSCPYPHAQNPTEFPWRVEPLKPVAFSVGRQVISLFGTAARGEASYVIRYPIIAVDSSTAYMTPTCGHFENPILLIVRKRRTRTAVTPPSTDVFAASPMKLLKNPLQRCSRSRPLKRLLIHFSRHARMLAHERRFYLLVLPR